MVMCCGAKYERRLAWNSWRLAAFEMMKSVFSLCRILSIRYSFGMRKSNLVRSSCGK